MSEIKWTEEQKAAIDFPFGEHSACVSAAAGSGKTALLTERVVKLIQGDEEHNIPAVDADKFAILTFTRNAAEEFRSRMTKAIEKASKQGDISKTQLIKFRRSVTSTINSFCLNVLKENIQLFDLPMNFSIADTGVEQIMRQKAMDMTTEYFYSNEFLNDFKKENFDYRKKLERIFVEKNPDKPIPLSQPREQLLKLFTFRSDDTALRRAIMSVYDFYASLSNGAQWLENCVESYSDIESQEKNFLPGFAAELRQYLIEFDSVLKPYKSFCDKLSGDVRDGFLDVYQKDLNVINGVVNKIFELFPENSEPKINNLFELYPAIKDAALSRFAVSKKAKEDLHYSDYKEKADKYRNALKKILADAAVKVYFDKNFFAADLMTQQETVFAFVKLVKRFEQEYSSVKRKKRLVDFADCERMLLAELRENSALRSELSDRFKYIIVDEFQDTNDLQYEIIKLISDDCRNLFFVGDIKQAIYSFRGGNPQIMADCIDDTAHYTKLPLNRNFRSRAEVINTVNAMFEGVMTKQYCSIDYTDNNQLVQGASFPASKEDYLTEIYLLDFKSGNGGDTDDNNDVKAPDSVPAADNLNEIDSTISNDAAEARFTAALIDKMVKEKFQVKNDNNSTRDCRYGDFAVLVRKGAISIANYKDEMQKLGIPVLAKGDGNFLLSEEILLIMNFLRIIDNPQLDEELLNVLMSPLYGFTAEELAAARLGILNYDAKELAALDLDLEKIYDYYSKFSLFGCISMAAEPAENQAKFADKDSKAVFKALEDSGISCAINEKCRLFTENLRDFRSYAANNTIETLIGKIYADTDFFSVISTYPRGEVRLANIRRLRKYAADFEAVGDGSLHDFIRYINTLTENGSSLDEAAVIRDTSDAVQIYTMHGSKGLEMPIVILGGMGKKLHDEESKNLIFDRRTGIGIKQLYLDKRIKTNSLGFMGVYNSKKSVELGEELRLLYVAMTRAKEKLIMVGTVDEKTKELVRLDFSQQTLLSKEHYIDWILYSLMKSEKPEFSVEKPAVLSLGKDTLQVRISVYNEKLPDPDSTDNEKNSPQKLECEALPDLEAAEQIKSAIEAEYKYSGDLLLKSRYSVTEAAHFGEKQAVEPKDIRVFRAEFDENKNQVNNAAIRGTTYHHIMELFPLEKELLKLSENEMEQRVRREIELMIKSEELTAEEIACCNYSEAQKNRIIHDVAGFFLSDLGKQVLTAQRVEREYKIFAELSVDSYLDGLSGESFFQGRVDMFYFKDEKLVIVDYKSDSKINLQKELTSYSKQLKLYKEALPLLIPDCKNGVEMVIYSFSEGIIPIEN